MAHYITKLFDRLDRIVEKRYGATDNRLVEFVLDANPGLERHAILLPPGLTIHMPDRPKTPTRNRVIKRITLLG